MVVAQLAERPITIAEVSGSNPVIDKMHIEHLFGVNCVEKAKMNKKRQGMAPLKIVIKLEGVENKSQKIAMF